MAFAIKSILLSRYKWHRFVSWATIVWMVIWKSINSGEAQPIAQEWSKVWYNQSVSNAHRQDPIQCNLPPQKTSGSTLGRFFQGDKITVNLEFHNQQRYILRMMMMMMMIQKFSLKEILQDVLQTKGKYAWEESLEFKKKKRRGSQILMHI